MGGTDPLYTLGLIGTMLIGVASSLVVTLPVPYIMCSRRVNRDEVPILQRLFASAVENLRKGVLSDSLAEMWRRQIRAEALREEMSNKLQALSSEKECILWEGLINGQARKTQGVKGECAIEGDHQRKWARGDHAFGFFFARVCVQRSDLHRRCLLLAHHILKGSFCLCQIASASDKRAHPMAIISQSWQKHLETAFRSNRSAEHCHHSS